MNEEKVVYSDADLKEFKDIILAKIEKAQADLDILNSSYKNDRQMVQMTHLLSSKLLKRALKPYQKKRMFN